MQAGGRAQAERREGRVGAQDQTAVIKLHRWQRAQRQPLFQLGLGAFGLLPGIVLGGQVLQQCQLKIGVEGLQAQPQRMFTSFGVQQVQDLGQLRGPGQGFGHGPAGPAAAQRGPLAGDDELGQGQVLQARGLAPAEFGKGRVDPLESQLGVQQADGLIGLGEELQPFAATQGAGRALAARRRPGRVQQPARAVALAVSAFHAHQVQA